MDIEAFGHGLSVHVLAPKRAVCVIVIITGRIYLLLVYLVTALVPSLTACLASSPGSKRRIAV